MSTVLWKTENEKIACVAVFYGLAIFLHRMTGLINELDFLKKAIIIQWNVWKKRHVTACNQISRKKELILVMLKNTIIPIWREKKTQNL